MKEIFQLAKWNLMPWVTCHGLTSFELYLPGPAEVLLPNSKQILKRRMFWDGLWCPYSSQQFLLPDRYPDVLGLHRNHRQHILYIHRTPWRLTSAHHISHKTVCKKSRRPEPFFLFSSVKDGKKSKSRNRQYNLRRYLVATCFDTETYMYTKIGDTCQ